MRFTRVLPQIRWHLKNILKSRLYFHDWTINHIRFQQCDAAIMQDTLRIIKILHLYEHFACIYTFGPFQLVLLLRNHGRFWFHCEPIERQGSPGWKVDWLTIYASNVEINSWTLLGPKTPAFSIWEIEHIQHLETTCGVFFKWTYMIYIYMYITCAYIRIY